MAADLRELLRLDLEAVDLHKGLTGLASILALGVFVAVFGDIGMVAALASLFVVLADRPGPPRDRGIGMLLMTVVGTVIALIGTWAGAEHVMVSSLLTFVVVLLATVAAGLGPAYAVRGMLLSVWAVVAVGFAAGPETALQMAVAFAGGGLVAAGAIYVRTRAQPEPTLEEVESAARTIEQVVRSPLGWFAVLRAAAVGLAMWIGASLFPEHAIWAALTVILVMKARAGETIAAGLLRTIGTLAGVIAAEAVIVIGDGRALVLLAAFLMAGFGMAALHKVNYAVFVACLTALLVFSDQLVTGSGEATAIDRLLATLLGAAIAFIAIGMGRVVLGRPGAGTEEGPASEDQDRTPG